ncbi:MAG: gamma-glutamyl-gamma-aminobutyrate hydrolase family protein [Acidimicrobiales bacterium]
MAPYRFAPGRIGDWTDSGEAAPSAYLDALRRAGAVPAVVGGDPAGGPGDIAPEELLASFDGLLLLGGADVDPSCYGARPHPADYGADVERDRFEMGLARAAVDGGVPLLGVCRATQLINVAFGGTLHQHLPDLELGLAHGVPIGAGEPATHPVDVTADSRLASVVGEAGRLEACVSIHHQAVDRLGAGLVVTARSADGLVEAIETPRTRPGWCLAVQWHPERTASVDIHQQALFDALVAEARR